MEAIGRFTLRRKLGAGAFGSVYEAFDPSIDGTVALKVLDRIDAESLASFRREFRALQAVDHPNVVHLYDLHDGYFTMELVEQGKDFVSALRGGSGGEIATRDDAAPARVVESTIDWTVFRARTRELALGVAHLHARGLIHCDVKPSNALSSSDRVVLVDFGLVRDTKEQISSSGTPAYMAPEQLSGPASFASDCYAIGVMLFETIAGRRPFEGSREEIFRKKLHGPAPALSAFASGVPEDIAAIVAALLERDPEKRPTANDVAERLGGAKADPIFERQIFVGREQPLSALTKAEEGFVFVRGGSGMGKSTLLRRFRALTTRPVLEGRCHANESIAYKGFDGIIEGLVAACGGTNAAPLVRLFPSIAHSVERPSEELALDPLELRAQAFGAVRTMLSSLERPIVILDDAQWMGSDTAALVRALAEPPIPGTLFILAHRSEENGGPNIQALAEQIPQETLDIAPLSDAEARQLSIELGVNVSDERLRDARGNPFFVEQLASHEEATLEAILAARVRALPKGSERVLELVALAGGPIDRGVIVRASNISGSKGMAILSALRMARLVRAGSRGDTVDVYHDRLRTLLTDPDSDSDSITEKHGAIALALEAMGSDDFDALFHHGKRSTDPKRAIPWGKKAAARAEEALAFDRAATLHREILDIEESDEEREALARVLVSSGHGIDAADAFTVVADRATGLRKLELERSAVEQLFVCGAIMRALDASKRLVGHLGLRLHSWELASIATTIVLRLWLILRGFEWNERRTPSGEELVRIDLCETIAGGLGFVDPIRGAPFSARHTLYALRAGEPRRLARALALEGAYLVLVGSDARGDKALEVARAAATRSGETGALAAVTGICAFLCTLRGDFRKARAIYDESFRLYREHGAMRETTSHFEVSMLRQYYLNGLYHLGDFETLAHELPLAMTDAASRGNVLFGASLRVADASGLWLFQKRPDILRREVENAVAMVPSDRFLLIHFFAALALAQADLYEGKPALDRLEEVWPRVTRSLFLRARRTRVLAYSTYGRVLVAHGERERARACVKKIRGVRKPWAEVTALMLSASIDESREDLERGRALAESEGLGLYARLASKDPALAHLLPVYLPGV